MVLERHRHDDRRVLLEIAESAHLIEDHRDVLRRTHERLMESEVYRACLSSLDAAPVVDVYMAARKALGEYLDQNG